LTNSIHSNTGLGIDLFPLGVTPNDPGDADSGPNELQNFPVLTSASTGGGTTQIQGTLNSHAITAYRLEFFSNTTCDPSGYGEGERFLGSTNVATNATGSVSFNATFAGMSSFVTATATDPAGNTSEFSNCAPVAVVTPPKECHKGDGDGDVDREDRGKHHKAHAHMHKDDCDDRDKGEVDEDDEDAGEHFQSTEVSSSGFSFDNGTRTLTMSGTGLSNGLPVGFTVIAVDNGFLPGTVTLVLTDGYRISGPLVSGTIAIR
jgi:hypothetical protein